MQKGLRAPRVRVNSLCSPTMPHNPELARAFQPKLPVPLCGHQWAVVPVSAVQLHHLSWGQRPGSIGAGEAAAARRHGHTAPVLYQLAGGTAAAWERGWGDKQDVAGARGESSPSQRDSRAWGSLGVPFLLPLPQDRASLGCPVLGDPPRGPLRLPQNTPRTQPILTKAHSGRTPSWSPKVTQGSTLLPCNS